MITIQTALLGVGYVSAIGTALTEAGQKFVEQKADAELYVKLWFASGLISCLFWVRYITSVHWSTVHECIIKYVCPMFQSIFLSV